MVLLCLLFGFLGIMFPLTLMAYNLTTASLRPNVTVERLYYIMAAPTEVTPSPSSAAQRRAQRRVTRVDNRYHSGLLMFSYSVFHYHYYFFEPTSTKPQVVKKIYKNGNKRNEAHSGWSTSTKLLCSSTALKRCTTTEIL